MAEQTKIRLLPGFVLIEPITEETRGDFLVSEPIEGKINMGRVVAVGERPKDSFKVGVGQKVVFDSLAKCEPIYSGEGRGLILLTHEDIMAIMEEK